MNQNQDQEMEWSAEIDNAGEPFWLATCPVPSALPLRLSISEVSFGDPAHPKHVWAWLIGHPDFGDVDDGEAADMESAMRACAAEAQGAAAYVAEFYACGE